MLTSELKILCKATIKKSKPQLTSAYFSADMNSQKTTSISIKFSALLALLAVIAFTENTLSQTTDSLKNNVATDAVLKNQLTHAVLTWKAGNAKDAYLTLDSIISVPSNPNNAETKIKAANWTAIYLQQQFKYKQARFFIDSALIWSKQFNIGTSLQRSYETLSQWYNATGNLQGVISANETAAKINDSLQQLTFHSKIDSLQKKISLLEEQNAQLNEKISKENEVNAASIPNHKIWIYVLISIIIILIVILLLMNSGLQRLRSFPPAPSLPIEKRKIPPAPDLQEVKNTVVKNDSEITGTDDKIKLTSTQNAATKELTVRISEVELILVNATSLGNYGAGDSKVTRNLLIEYNTQLPLIMKALDKAIADSDVTGITSSLGFLKSYLVPFGMETTLNWITEIEEEVNAGAKVSKLLSRVFQIRNHFGRYIYVNIDYNYYW